MDQGNNHYFISDAHLGPNLPYPDQREAWLIDFFNQIRHKASHLFIVGDLFDFWVEYRHLIRSDYFNVLNSLARIVDNGVKVHYIAGNHDFALGSFLTDQIGIQTHLQDLSIRLNNAHLYLIHGDGLIASDKGYRLLKKLLRNPLLQGTYRLIHPSLGIGLATFFSKMSRRQETTRGPKFGYQAYRRVAWDLAAKGYDMVIMGHTHKPEIIHRQEKIYCNIGDWIQSFSYATLTDNTLQLWQYRPGSAPIQIKPKHH